MFRDQAGWVWERFVHFSDTYGNVASVVGLLIAMIGFAATLYRIGTINREVKAAEDNAKALIGLLGQQLLVFESAWVARSIELIINSCRSKDWQRAMYQCDDARKLIVRLSEHPDIDAELSGHIGQYADDLGRMSRYIGRYRLGASGDKFKDVPNDKLKRLQDIMAHFERVSIRARNSYLEARR